MAVKLQTDGFVVIGGLPNDEHYVALCAVKFQTTFMWISSPPNQATFRRRSLRALGRKPLLLLTACVRAATNLSPMIGKYGCFCLSVSKPWWRPDEFPGDCVA